MHPIRTGAILLFLVVFGAAGALRPSRTRAQVDANPHGNFKADCNLCHSSEGWTPARISADFDHGKYGLSLEGAHHETPCLSCHGSLDFSRERAECAECHEDIHEGELGGDCANCHTTRSFIDRTRMETMHRFTRLPLTGAHVTLDCMTCHPGGATGNSAFANIGFECVNCHREAMAAVTAPDHRSAGFSEDCTQCHGTRSWTPAAYGHSDTGFPLTGAHRFVDCAACHGEGQFTAVPSECVDCHQVDYDVTTEPVHSEFGFSTRCQDCHNTIGWRGANFQHGNFFPINSGAHQGKWSACSDCHINPSSYLDFSCFGCHPHSDESKTLDGHKEVANYSYDSLECYRCHPNGRH